MDFVGSSKIFIRTGTGKQPLALSFSAETAIGSNDGSIPYGSTIAGVTVTVKDSGGTDISAATVFSATTDGMIVNIKFNYPPLAAKGRCITLIALLLSTGATIVKRWDGLNIE